VHGHFELGEHGGDLRNERRAGERGGWLASIWNVVVTIGGQAFSILVNGVLQSIVGFVTQIATVWER